MRSKVSIASLLLAIGVTPLAAGDWPGFRGDGSSTAASGDYPVDWSPDRNIAWKTDLPGYGQSSPVMANGVIYVTATEGPNKETNHVVAIDAGTGKERWRHSFASSSPAKNTPMIGRAAPTPAADANGVYAFFESGDLVALSTDGTVQWQRALTQDYGPFTNRHGLGSSLAQREDALYVLVDQKADGYLAAISKSDGNTRWKTARTDRNGWSSPAVAELCGTSQIVISSSGLVEGYDASTGHLLWSHEGLSGNSIPSPTIQGDTVLVGARLGRQGGDVPTITRSNCCIRIRREGETFSTETAWQAEKVLSHYASPLVADGFAYLTNNVGVLFRLDSKTGELIDRVRAGRPSWTTPVAAAGRIYVFGDDGTTAVFQSGEGLPLVATNQLWDEATAPSADPYAVQYSRSKEDAGDSPSESTTSADSADSSDGGYDRPTVYGVAAADNSFFIRTGTRLYCVRSESMR